MVTLIKERELSSYNQTERNSPCSPEMKQTLNIQPTLSKSKIEKIEINQEAIED